MLMMCGKNLVMYDSTIRKTDFVERLVNRLSRQNTGRTNLEMDICGLAKSPCKDVFVVGDGNDSLQDQDTRSSDSSDIGSVVGMLPANAIVLFMETDHIIHLQRSAVGVRNVFVKILLLDIADW